MSQDDIFKRFVKTIPSRLNPQFNRVISSLLKAIAFSDAEVEQQIQNAKDQLFIPTATGQDLNRLAKSFGVSRPPSLGLTDNEFQQLVPNLGLKSKQIRKSFYDTADVFWGPLFSRANVTTANTAPFGLNIGDILRVTVDNGDQQEIKILSDDIAVNGSATTEETKAILEKITGISVEIIEDPLTGDESLNIRTNTPGPVGSLLFDASSTMLGVSKLDLPTEEISILSLDQRVALYSFEANEILIEIPAILPVLRRTLKGSHHFHEDSTLEPPKGTAQGIWQGSFLFDPAGVGGSFTLSSQRATLQQDVDKGNIYTSIVVDDTSLFNDQSGFLVFSFGGDEQEVPVRFRGVPNSNTILLDPSYVFENDHPSGTIVNVISQQEPYEPTRDGDDLAVYLTSPSGSRQIVQDILRTLAAAGIVVRFIILAPEYKYLIDNPYIETDDAPSI